MIEKDHGNPRKEHFWVIHFFEANYNFCLELLWGHQLVYHREDNNCFRYQSLDHVLITRQLMWYIRKPSHMISPTLCNSHFSCLIMMQQAALTKLLWQLWPLHSDWPFPRLECMLKHSLECNTMSRPPMEFLKTSTRWYDNSHMTAFCSYSSCSTHHDLHGSLARDLQQAECWLIYGWHILWMQWYPPWWTHVL
jgi:hypothetical protein